MVRPEKTVTNTVDEEVTETRTTLYVPGHTMDTRFGPFFWNLTAFTVLTRLKYTILSRVSGGHYVQGLTLKTLLAYIFHEEEKRNEKCIEILLEVLGEQPGNLCALGTLYCIYDQSHDKEKCQTILEQITQHKQDKRLLRQARYEEAFAYLEVGHRGSKMAQNILEDLYTEDPDNSQVLLDIILCMVRQTDMKAHDNPTINIAYLNNIGQYIDLAVKLIPDEPALYSRILHMIVAVRTSSIGKGWVKKFLKNRQNLKPEKCIERALDSLHRDGRDISVYTNIIRFYDRSLNFEAAYKVAIDASQQFPKDKFFIARQGTYHLEKAKQEFKISKKVDKCLLELAISIFNKLLSEKEWYLRYKMAMQLGTAYYIEGDPQLAYKHYNISLDLFTAEYNESPRISQIYFNWCFILVLCNEADEKKVNFSHMRTALRIKQHVTREPDLRSLPILFRKALEENPDSIFYLLCNGYLELETGKTPKENYYFTKALSKQRNCDTLLGMAEYCFAQSKHTEALSWLEESRKNALQEKDKAYEDHVTTLSENIYHRGKKNDIGTSTEQTTQIIYNRKRTQLPGTFDSSVDIHSASASGIQGFVNPSLHDRDEQLKGRRKEFQEGNSHGSLVRSTLHSLNTQRKNAATENPGKKKNAYTAFKLKHREPIFFEPSPREIDTSTKLENKENMDSARSTQKGISQSITQPENESTKDSLTKIKQTTTKVQNKEPILKGEFHNTSRHYVSPQPSTSTIVDTGPEIKNAFIISELGYAQPIAANTNSSKISQSAYENQVVVGEEKEGYPVTYKKKETTPANKRREKTSRTVAKPLLPVTFSDPSYDAYTTYDGPEEAMLEDERLYKSYSLEEKSLIYSRPLDTSYDSSVKCNKSEETMYLKTKGRYKTLGADVTLTNPDTAYVPSGLHDIHEDTDDLFVYSAYSHGNTMTEESGIYTQNNPEDYWTQYDTSGSYYLSVATPPSR